MDLRDMLNGEAEASFGVAVSVSQDRRTHRADAGRLTLAVRASRPARPGAGGARVSCP